MNKPIPDASAAAGSTLAVGSALHWPCPHGCLNWCRTDGSMTDHHPRCEYVDESLIDVWKVSYDGRHYYTDRDPADEPEVLCGDEVITKERMHREIYENLPDFAGF